jgi:hypothetical protein
LESNLPTDVLWRRSRDHKIGMVIGIGKKSSGHIDHRRGVAFWNLR